MKATVIGASGQLGRALRKTAPATIDLIALDRAACDLSDAFSIEAVIEEYQPDIVINAAAYTAVDQAESDVDAAMAVNATAIATLVKALSRTSGKLVHISTDFVFEGEATVPCRPDSDRNPLSVYGRSKAQGEDYLRDTDLLVRTSWVYEVGGGNFVRTMLRLMRERDEIRVVADQLGSPTWARSLGTVIWRLAVKGASGAYHYSDGGTASWYDFATAIAQDAHAIGLLDTIPRIVPMTTQDYPTPARRPKYSVLDCSSTHAVLGTEPTAWRDNLRQMLKEELALG